MLVIISYWQHKVNNLQSRKALLSKTAKFPSKSWESTVFATVTFWEGCQNQSYMVLSYSIFLKNSWYDMLIKNSV